MNFKEFMQYINEEREVIRCKDCKHRVNGTRYCIKLKTYMPLDAFCFESAEKRE